MALTWKDSEDIAIVLHEQEPHTDPLTVRFTALRDKVIALPDFEDKLENLNEKILEAIQMAWYEEYNDS